MSGDGKASGVGPQGEYRRYLFDLSIPRFTSMKTKNAHEYAREFLETDHQPPWLYALYKHWRQLFAQPYKGITTDGSVRPDLFQLQDEGIPTDKIAEATENFLSLLSDEQRAAAVYHVDSPEWRSWSNPEFLLVHKGIRLDDHSQPIRDAARNILKQTLSPEGYNKAISAMRINHFLGELVESPAVMNEYSYNVTIFGQPSTERPWGFSYYGHHLCLNAFFYKNQIFFSPWFTGAEPNEIDSGPHAGTQILTREADMGLELMQSFEPEQQKTAQIFKELNDPAMPPGRWNRDDQRHLCGAYRDNRVVPYEGVLYKDMNEKQQKLVADIFEEYFLYLPEQARRLRLKHALSFPDETYFCWIGSFGDTDPFYYRIQNPVVIVEFDHHSGVFLNNSEPAKFHIHTILRTPNAGDYGMAVRPLIPAVEDKFVWDGK